MNDAHAPDGDRYVIPQQPGTAGGFGPPPPMGPGGPLAPGGPPAPPPGPPVGGPPAPPLVDERPRIALAQGEALPVARTGKRLLAFTVDQLIAWTLVVALGAAVSGALVAYVQSQVSDPVFWQDILRHAFSSAWPRLVAGHAEAAGEAALDTAVQDLVDKLLVPVLAGVAVIVLAVAFLPVVYQWAGLNWFGTTPGRLLAGVKVVRPPHPHDLPDRRPRRLPARHALVRSLIGPPLLVLGLLLAIPAGIGMAALGVTITGVLVLALGALLVCVGAWDPIHALTGPDPTRRTLHDRASGTLVVDLCRAEAARRLAGTAGAQMKGLAGGAVGQAGSRLAGLGAQARDSQAVQSAGARLAQARDSSAAQAAASRLAQARDSNAAQAAAARLAQARQSDAARRLGSRLRQAKNRLSPGDDAPR